MQNIPMFTTQFGIASLTFQDIPYLGNAYIKIQDTAYPEEFLQECVEFCRAAGAEHIYASGHPWLEQFAEHTAIWLMSCGVDVLPETDAALMPVTQETLEYWCVLYNQKMKDVPNASYMSQTEAKKMLLRGDGYFVHRGEALLGIGIASGDRINAVAAVVPGTGAEVLAALCHAVTAERVFLEVASANVRAVRLYRRLGFVATQELSKWYCV